MQIFKRRNPILCKQLHDIISNSTWHTFSSYIEFNDTIALEGTHFEINR